MNSVKDNTQYVDNTIYMPNLTSKFNLIFLEFDDDQYFTLSMTSPTKFPAKKDKAAREAKAFESLSRQTAKDVCSKTLEIFGL
jgi:hypothetical protein